MTLLNPKKQPDRFEPYHVSDRKEGVVASSAWHFQDEWHTFCVSQIDPKNESRLNAFGKRNFQVANSCQNVSMCQFDLTPKQAN